MQKPSRLLVGLLLLTTLKVFLAGCTGLSQSPPTPAQTSTPALSDSGDQQPTAAVSAQRLRPLLNSERIRLVFGSYGVNVLEHTDRLRVVSLYSLARPSQHSSQHSSQSIEITRTMAGVFYPADMPAAIADAHRLIRQGQSLGAVFKQRGWTISKKPLYFGEINGLGADAGVFGLMQLNQSSGLACHVYQFVVEKQGQQYYYATIAEVHHPDYLNMSRLTEIYGEQTVAMNSDVTVISTLMAELRVKLQAK